MKKTKVKSVHKTGKLFSATRLSTGSFVLDIDAGIVDLVCGNDEKKFESYLRKSFRHFYNLDKKLKVRNRPGRAKINTL